MHEVFSFLSASVTNAPRAYYLLYIVFISDRKTKFNPPTYQQAKLRAKVTLLIWLKIDVKNNHKCQDFIV